MKIVFILGMPKHYKNAYVRFCDAVRPKAMEEQPTLDPVALTKLVAERWYKSSVEERREYEEEAKKDKERFNEEMRVYKEEHPDFEGTTNGKSKKKKKKGINNEENEKSNEKSDKKEKSSKKSKENETQNEKKSDENHIITTNNFELPIFTDVFLSHNTTIETELKELKKSNNSTELQNDFLQKFIENMQSGIAKITDEISSERQVNSNLEMYLTRLRCTLASSFNSLSLPNTKTASVENIDDYLNELTSDNNNLTASIINKSKDIIKKADLKAF
jgi:hypothetical protein